MSEQDQLVPLLDGTEDNLGRTPRKPRPLDKVKAEWAMICTAHNLTKLARLA